MIALLNLYLVIGALIILVPCLLLDVPYDHETFLISVVFALLWPIWAFVLAIMLLLRGVRT